MKVEAYLIRVGFSTSENAARVVGVARIEATEEALVEGIRRIETFRTGERVIETGRFGTPPSVEDLQLLVFDRQDLEDLRKCQIGDCDIKLDAETIALAKMVDWTASDHAAQASQMLKLALVTQVKGYLERGAAGMAVYHDKEAPQSAAAEFAKLLQSTPRLIQDDRFQRYLLEFPSETLPNVESFLYWSKEMIRKPVVSVVHVCLQRVESGGEASYYAEFLTVIPYSGSAKSFYLVHSVRARIDRPRWFGGMLLGKIKREMRSALSRDLMRTKKRLEAWSED